MAEEDTGSPEETATVTTEVEIPVTPEETPAETPDTDVTVINVDTPEADSGAIVVDINHEQRLTRMEDMLSAIVSRLDRTESVAESAAVVAEVAAETAQDALLEDEPEPDREPTKKHVLHRSWGELLGRNS